MPDALESLLINSRQVGGALLLLLSAYGFGGCVVRGAGQSRRGFGGVCLDVLVGLALLTGFSGWLCVGWLFTRPAGFVVLAVGWALAVAAGWVRARSDTEHIAPRSSALVKWSFAGLVGLAAVLGIRAYGHEFSWADDWRYHLTVPKRILADAGYRYDSFMVEANFNYGGEHGLHALGLLLGDETTYQILSPAAALLLLGVVLFRWLEPRYGPRAAIGGLAAMLGCNFFWRMGFITLVPDVLFAAFVAAIFWILLDRARQSKPAGLGLVCGLLLAALLAQKKTHVFVLPHVLVGYLLCSRGLGQALIRRLLCFAGGGALAIGLIFLPWVLIELRNTGSPFYAFVGDQRHVFAWLLERDLKLLDMPLGLGQWIWNMIRAQYLEARGGLLWIYALTLPGLIAAIAGARRGVGSSRSGVIAPLLVTIPPALLFSAYLIASRGTDLNTHTRYLLPVALPGIAVVVAWSLWCYGAQRRRFAPWARVALNAVVALALVGNLMGSRVPLAERVAEPAWRAARTLVWGDVARRFWDARAKEPPYREFHACVPFEAKVLTFVQKTALIDASRPRVHSITKAMTGVVDVHRLSDPQALLAALRAEGFEYVFVTFEWLMGREWALEQEPSKLTDWSATAQTLENLIRLRELDEVETVRSLPDALILRLPLLDPQLARRD